MKWWVISHHPANVNGYCRGNSRNLSKRGTTVFTGNDTFLTENITQDRKRFITQPKHMMF